MHYEVANERTKDLVRHVKTYFNQEENHTIYDKRNVIKVVHFEGKRYVVKSFKTPHLLNQIVYRFFRDSKAKRSFINSMKLKQLGIDTPEPVGYIEFPTLLRFRESFYISKFFDFDFEIRAVLKDKAFEERETILKKFIEYTYRLHQKKVYHLDYSPGNILVKKVDGVYRFSIIDVNRMAFMELDDTLRMQNLSKLTNDREDNLFMARYYAQIAKRDEALLVEKLTTALEKQKTYLERKKRLKRLKQGR